MAVRRSSKRQLFHRHAELTLKQKLLIHKAPKAVKATAPFGAALTNSSTSTLDDMVRSVASPRAPPKHVLEGFEGVQVIGRT
jgi:hypothetical protein